MRGRGRGAAGEGRQVSWSNLLQVDGGGGGDEEDSERDFTSQSESDVVV
jgi:hypothetical protein